MFILDENAFENTSKYDLVNQFDSQIRPIVFYLRESLEDQIFAVQDPSVQTILQKAPIDLCIQLAETLNAAEMMGLTSEEIRIRFDPTEQFIIEMINEMYRNSKCDLATMQNTPNLESSFVRSLSVN